MRSAHDAQTSRRIAQALDVGPAELKRTALPGEMETLGGALDPYGLNPADRAAAQSLALMAMREGYDAKSAAAQAADIVFRSRAGTDSDAQPIHQLAQGDDAGSDAPAVQVRGEAGSDEPAFVGPGGVNTDEGASPQDKKADGKQNLQSLRAIAPTDLSDAQKRQIQDAKAAYDRVRGLKPDSPELEAAQRKLSELWTKLDEVSGQELARYIAEESLSSSTESLSTRLGIGPRQDEIRPLPRDYQYVEENLFGQLTIKPLGDMVAGWRAFFGFDPVNPFSGRILSPREAQDAKIRAGLEAISGGMTGYARRAGAFAKSIVGEFDEVLDHRLITQSTDNIDKIFQQAKNALSGFKRKLREIAGDTIDTEIEGPRIKERERLMEKIDAIQKEMLKIGVDPDSPESGAHLIRDYIAGRLIPKDQKGLDTILQELKKRFVQIDIKDSMIKPNAKSGYTGIHIQVRLPNGITSELQIVPKVFLDAATKQRKIFENWRKFDGKIPDNLYGAYQADYKKSREIFAEAWNQWIASGGRDVRDRMVKP